MFACGCVCIWMDFWAHRHFPTPFTPTLSLRQLLCLIPKGTHFPDDLYKVLFQRLFLILLDSNFRFIPVFIDLTWGTTCSQIRLWQAPGNRRHCHLVSEEENEEPPSCLLVGANKILPSPFLELFRTLVNRTVLGGVANSMACH